MRSERGQASVEWIAVVLLVAIALAAAARFAPRADGRSVATTVMHSVTHPARRPARPPPEREAFGVPALIPRPGQVRPRLRIRLPEAPALVRRARRGAGAAWRRAWVGCLIYERGRWALLHPESRFPGYTIPRSELVRMANDCISPVDLVRDWRLLKGR